MSRISYTVIPHLPRGELRWCCIATVEHRSFREPLVMQIGSCETEEEAWEFCEGYNEANLWESMDL